MNMKRTIEMILMTLLIVLAAVFVGSTLMGCSSDSDDTVDNQKEIELKNFSNSGCKNRYMSRAEDDSNASFEYSVLHDGYLYINHRNVMFNCCPGTIGADIQVDGNKILIGEYETEDMCDCDCPYDLGYEVGPLVEGKSYTIYIGYKGQELKVAEFTFQNSMSGTWESHSAWPFDTEADKNIKNENTVRGGEVYEGWGKPEVDESDPLAVFFRDELHGPYWDGAGNEFKTFFEQGSWDEEDCLVINSSQEFQEAYMGTKDLPEVDFSKYTLLIGKTWGGDSSYRLDEVILRDKVVIYELETRLLHYVDRGAYAAIVEIYYWRLYPKLEKKDIVLKRTVKDVND